MSKNIKFAVNLNNWQRRYATLGRGYNELVHNKFLAGVVIVCLALALSTPLMLWYTLQSIKHNIGLDTQMHTATLYFKPQLATGQVQKTQQLLQTWPELSKVEYVTKDSVLEQLRQHGGLQQVTGDLEENPLPDMLMVTLQTAVLADANMLNILEQKLLHLTGIDDVQFDYRSLAQSAAVWNMLQYSVMCIGILIAGLLLVICTNAMRAFCLKQDELLVYSLLGATPTFVFTPLLYCGALCGLAGAGIACGVMYGYQLLMQSIGYNEQQVVGMHLSVWGYVGLILVSLIFGWLMAMIINRLQHKKYLHIDTKSLMTC